MNMKRTTLAAAVLAACAMGASGQAAAEAYTGASLDVSGLTIGLSPLAATSITNFTFNVSNTATLGATAPVATSATCVGGNLSGTACSTIPPVLTAGAANGTGSSPTRANNDYTLFGPATNGGPTGTYANSNSLINTAELVTGTPSSATAVSEVQLMGTGTGQANNAVSSNTSLSFDFSVVGGPGSVSLNFSATPFIETLLNSSNLIGSSGLGKVTAEFLLQNGTGSVVADYNPGKVTGSVACTTGLSCTDTTPFSLNKQVNLGSNPSDILYNPGSGLFAFNVGNLPQGDYSLNLSMLTNVNVTQTIPEPATPALMALGLVGMGATLRRRQALRRRKQA